MRESRSRGINQEGEDLNHEVPRIPWQALLDRHYRQLIDELNFSSSTAAPKWETVEEIAADLIAEVPELSAHLGSMVRTARFEGYVQTRIRRVLSNWTSGANKKMLISHRPVEGLEPMYGEYDEEFCPMMEKFS